jgi:hypothetical protein
VQGTFAPLHPLTANISLFEGREHCHGLSDPGRAIAIEVQNVQSDCAREIFVRPTFVNLTYEFGKRHIPQRRNFLRAFPKFILQTDARLVVTDNDGTLYNGRLHNWVLS